RPILQEPAQHRPEFLLLLGEAEFHECCSSPARGPSPRLASMAISQRVPDALRCKGVAAPDDRFALPHVNDCISVHRLQATSLAGTIRIEEPGGELGVAWRAFAFPRVTI